MLLHVRLFTCSEKTFFKICYYSIILIKRDIIIILNTYFGDFTWIYSCLFCVYCYQASFWKFRTWVLNQNVKPLTINKKFQISKIYKNVPCITRARRLPELSPDASISRSVISDVDAKTRHAEMPSIAICSVSHKRKTLNALFQVIIITLITIMLLFLRTLVHNGNIMSID